MAERKAPTGTITGMPALDTTWQTPPELLQPVRDYFGGVIPFDAATAVNNPTGAAAYAAGDAAADIAAVVDGLAERWAKYDGTFVNPPYGKVLREWLAKMVDEAREGAVIIALLPCARWEQGYFQAALCAANAACFIRKRVNFIRPSTGDRVAGNPYANFFLGFNVEPETFARAFGPAGCVVSLEMLAPPPTDGLRMPGPAARVGNPGDAPDPTLRARFENPGGVPTNVPAYGSVVFYKGQRGIVRAFVEVAPPKGDGGPQIKRALVFWPPEDGEPGLGTEQYVDVALLSPTPEKAKRKRIADVEGRFYSPVPED